MNDYLLALILGIVEGLTEFLPVSSTAHLRISEALLHHSGLASSLTLDNGYWKMYLDCHPAWRDSVSAGVFLEPHHQVSIDLSPRRKRQPHGADASTRAYAIAFVVTAIPSFLLTKVIGKHLENIVIIGWSLLIGGVIMWIVDAMHAKAEAAGPNGKHSDPHLEDGRHEPWTIDLDWLLPDLLGCVPRNLAIDVDHRSRTNCRHVARFRPRIFLLRIDPDDGRSHALYALQIPSRKGRKSDRRRADRRPWMDCIGDRLHRFVHRRLRLGCLVHGVREETRLCALRRLSDRHRNSGASLRGQALVEK